MLCTAAEETQRKRNNQKRAKSSQSQLVKFTKTWPTNSLIPNPRSCQILLLRPQSEISASLSCPFSLFQMAKTISRSNHNHKAFHVLGLFSLLLLIQKGGAFEFKVGGSYGWSVPNDSAPIYNQWAERNRFQIGDTLLFVYPSNKDVVLQVTKDDYTNCTTATPIAKYSDGHTVIKLNQSGPFYFVSGLKDNCLKNEKLLVVVMADRSNQTSVPSSPPSPAPAGDEYPSPPPAGSVEMNPSPAPSADQTPPPSPSGASSIVMTFVGCFGAFLGSSLVLVF